MHSRLNRIYKHIKERCYSPNCKDYKDYGARGITVCEEWLEKQRVGEGSKGWYSFRDWALANGYSDELSIDRIDVNKGYSPSNCRWVSPKVQANNKRSNCYITYKGKTQSLMKWCEELGLEYSRVKARINRCNWTVEQAFEIKEPLKLRRRIGGVAE